MSYLYPVPKQIVYNEVKLAKQLIFRILNAEEHPSPLWRWSDSGGALHVCSDLPTTS